MSLAKLEKSGNLGQNSESKPEFGKLTSIQKVVKKIGKLSEKLGRLGVTPKIKKGLNNFWPENLGKLGKMSKILKIIL